MKLKTTVTVAHDNTYDNIVEPVIIPFDWTSTDYDSIINYDTVSYLSYHNISPPPANKNNKTAASLPGNDSTPLVNKYNITFNVILLTDCIFSVLMVPALIRILKYYSNHSTTIYCCHEIRDAVITLYYYYYSYYYVCVCI